MTTLAIIGGTGLTQLRDLTVQRSEVVRTPWGEASAPITHGMLKGVQVCFLPRHGHKHTIPPHKVNYRANIWALKHIGVETVIAIAAVGGINASLSPGDIVIPDQIIDYTYGRGHTFFEENLDNVVHVDFTHPYDKRLKSVLIEAGTTAGVPLSTKGVYGATQGPRLETAAEVNRLQQDGCDIVGMTGMPEAVLAREIQLSYAHCCVVANPAAGRSSQEITIEGMQEAVSQGMEYVKKILHRAIPNYLLEK